MDVNVENIRGVLFDKDGTLFDFSATWFAASIAFIDAHFSPEDQNKALAVWGMDREAGAFSPDSIVIAGSPDDTTEALIEAFPGLTSEEIWDGMVKAANEAPVVEAVPLKPLLTKLKSMGLRLGVATNDFEDSARRHLALVDVEADFEFVAGYDSGFGQKPDIGMQKGFLAHTGLEPHQVLMVGDSLHDLHSGRAAGMPTLAVLTGLATEERLAPHADWVLPDIGGLPNLLTSKKV